MASKSKPFPLLSLPNELLDLVLSHTVIIPWHPKNGVYTTEAIHDLFSPTLHVNRKLRRQTIDIITRDTLWVQVTCQSREVYREVNFLYGVVPDLPPVYRVLLPDPIPGVIMSIGGPIPARSTRTFNKATSTLISPYNIDSFTRLYSTILVKASELKEIMISFVSVPAHYRTLVDDRIRPILDGLPVHSSTPFVNYDGSQTKLVTPDDGITYSSAVSKINAVISHMQALDRAGRSLEASFLALSLRAELRASIMVGNEFAPTVNWVENLVTGSYLTQPDNLERMRIVRTLHHIDYRACMAYLSSADKHGSYWVGEDDSEEIRCDQHGSDWLMVRYGMEWYGLPDHELAQLYYMRARLLAHRERAVRSCFLGRDSYGETTKIGSDLAFQATRHAYVAWRLDKSSVMYAIWFKRMAEAYPDQAHRLLCKSIYEARSNETFIIVSNDVMATVRTNDVDGYRRVYGGTLDVYYEGATQLGSFLQYIHRAREVAKRADVVFGMRREEELSKLEYEDTDEDEVLRYLICDSETKLKFDRFGVTKEDFEAFEEKERRERRMLESWGTLD